jgi:hypothetical protein
VAISSIWPASGLMGDRKYQGTKKVKAEPLLFIVNGRNRGYT